MYVHEMYAHEMQNQCAEIKIKAKGIVCNYLRLEQGAIIYSQCVTGVSEMGKKITIIVLACLFVVSGVLAAIFFNSANVLQSKLDDKTILLEQTTAELAQNKTDLAEARSELRIVEAELSSVRNNLTEITNKLTQSAADVFYYKNQVSSLTKTAEDNKFYFYYVKPKQQFGIYNLDSFVRGRSWLKPYQEGVFDCSEMSATIEWELENAGFHTKIAVGETPGKPGTHHAWLLVETEVGKYTPVETTGLFAVWPGSSYFNDYFKYDRIFETIQEALAYSPTEFDWWES